MAETVITEFAKFVLGQLGSLAVEELKLAVGLEDEVDSIKSNLSSIQAVLRDAEKQQITSESIKNWLGKLEDIMYDIDDVLDDIKTEVQLRAMNKGQWHRKVRKFFSHTNSLVLRWQWTHQIKSLCEKLDRISSERRNFVLLAEEMVDSEEPTSARETHSKPNKSDLILGREDEKEAIINSILSCGDHDSLSVVPIVGIGGVGKTTLAQLVYNDSRIDDSFDKKLWVYVSEKFRIKKVLKQVISMATGESILQMTIEQLSLEILRIKVSNTLKHNKYLLVLDDLWNEDSNEWRKLIELLDVGVKGSTMIVTTRGSKVASITHTVEECRLKELTHETSLQIFKKLAFKDGGENIKPALKNLANKIVAMSKGLPLVVTTLGKLLHGETDEEKWGRVIRKLEHGHEEILNVLKLSYDQLTSYSKICFRFLPICRDYLELGDMISMWMALGYIPSGRQGEEIGRDCIEELLSKSLIIEDVHPRHPYMNIATDIAKEFRMHDHVYDLAKSIIGEEYVKINCSTKEVPEKVRYLAINEDKVVRKQLLPGILLQARKTRYFAINTTQPLNKTFLKTILSSFPFLRVLDLGDCQFENLPRTIGYMKHLRYLNLKGNMRIRHLPSSFSNLFNLQTLYLCNCPNLQELPVDIERLQNLRSLFVSTKQFFLPEGIGSIKGLRNLFIMTSPNLAFLPMSINHLENLEILVVGKCEELDLGHESGLLEGLNSLRTLMIGGLPKFRELSTAVQGLPFPSLQHLCVFNCDGLTDAGDWIKHFTSLRSLYINNCPNLVKIPDTLSLLHNLENLTVVNCEVLSQRCRPDNGDDWHLISNIPHKHIFISM